jgi:CRISPR system Cascade subunit CasC
MFVELHMLQNFAPSCLNRDDTNAPKDCEFGGFRRARISSQCLKRSIRLNPSFSETIEEEVGYRTKHLYKHLKDELVQSGKDESVIDEVLTAFIPKVLGAFEKKNTKKTSVLFYLSKREIDGMKDLLMKNWDSLSATADKKKKLEEACDTLSKGFSLGALSPDIALFGRMMAERTKNNVDAAAQVAHAISTNRVNMDMDFYTAVDDLQEQEETGAGMMGTVEFNSACFYRYSAINIEQLLANLGNDPEHAKRSILAFINASITAIPTGKQTSMAAHNYPSMIVVTVREGQPMSLANAFVKPVSVYKEEGLDLVEKSMEKFDDYFGQLHALYGSNGTKYVGACAIGPMELQNIKNAGGVQYTSLDELLTSLAGTLNDSIDASS